MPFVNLFIGGSDVMLLLICIVAACVALQFTSGITQFLALNKDAARASAGVKWLAQKIGVAPTLITTRVLIWIFFALVYLFLKNAFFWLVLAGCVYYLYSTGRWMFIWKKVEEEVVQKVEDKVFGKSDTPPSKS